MSKKKGQRKKRRKRSARSPDRLLASLAACLNACEKAGMTPRFRHGAVWTGYGVVLPPYRKDGWAARRLIPDGDRPHAGDLDD